MFGRRPQPLDLCAVVSPRNRGWVLDTVARELAGHAGARAAVHYGRRLPAADRYFFTHYSLFVDAVDRIDDRAVSVVFFTHPSHRDDREEAVLRTLSRADVVVSMSSLYAAWLVDRGVPAERVHVVIPGADPQRFRPHEGPGGGAVGFSTAYYARKDPGRIEDLVRALPGREFVLVGKDWRAWDGFGRLRALPNFEYIEAPYDRYPSIYRRFAVLVSPAQVEGGPLPLLEAMLCGVVPVASRTGFAADLIEHGKNGFLFDVGAPIDEVASLVEASGGITADVRSSVVHHTWPAFASQVVALADAARGNR